MTSVSSEPPTLRPLGADSFSPSASSAPQPRSYSCYHCNISFHIIPTSTISPSAPSSFRCPGCHHRHLIPYHIVSLPLPPITATSRIPNYTAPAPPSSFDYESDYDDEDYDDEDEDYYSDNSLPSLTAPDSDNSLPSLTAPDSKSIVGSLRVKMFSPNSTTQPLQCSICMVDFDVSSCVIVNELPCEHYFHRDCIVEWLQRNNSCPLCRYKLPLDPNKWGDEYDAVSVVDLARAREPTDQGRAINTNREERLSSNTEANGAASGSEDGDTLMTEV